MALDGVLVCVRIGRPDDDWLDNTTCTRPLPSILQQTRHLVPTTRIIATGRLIALGRKSLRSGPLMRLITPTLPGLGFKREGINQRNIASRTHWTQPQTCEPRHFLTPSTERNNYLVSDTVRARLNRPYSRPSLQCGQPFRHVVLTVLCLWRSKRVKKDSRPVP